MHADDDEATIDAERLEAEPLDDEAYDDDAYDDEWDDADEAADRDGSAPDEPPRRARRRLTPVAGGLLAVLLVAGGFIGGVLVQKGQGGGAGADGLPAGIRAAMAGGAMPGGAMPGASGAPGATGGAQAGGSSATVGEVTTVDGDKLFVTDQQGNTLEVTAAKGATVTRQVDSEVRAIRPGETVIVQGAAKDGAIVATSIRASQAGAGNVAGAGGGGTLDQLFGDAPERGADSTTTEAP